MSRDNLIDFLWQRWVIVVTFFNELYPQVQIIIPHFYDILNQRLDAQYQQTIAFVSQYIASTRTYLLNYTDAKVNTLKTQLLQIINQSEASVIPQLNALRSFVMDMKEELLKRMDVNYDELRSRIEQAKQELTSLIMEKTGQMGFDLKQLGDELHSLIGATGLIEPENKAFLKVFVNKPYDYIQIIVYETLFELLKYVLANGLTREDREIEPPPKIDKLKPTED